MAVLAVYKYYVPVCLIVPLLGHWVNKGPSRTRSSNVGDGVFITSESFTRGCNGKRC